MRLENKRERLLGKSRCRWMWWLRILVHGHAWTGFWRVQNVLVL